jgi:hypothetical protein
MFENNFQTTLTIAEYSSIENNFQENKSEKYFKTL